MNEQLWTTFKTEAEIGTLSRASRSLNLSQSALTQQIHRLEQYYQGPLFVRTSQGMHLTSAGEVLYNRYVNNLLRMAHESQDAVIRTHKAPPRRFTIGASFTIAEYILPDIFPTYCRRHSDSGISVMMFNSRALFFDYLQVLVSPDNIISPGLSAPRRWKAFFADPQRCVLFGEPQAHTTHYLSVLET